MLKTVYRKYHQPVMTRNKQGPILLLLSCFSVVLLLAGCAGTSQDTVPEERTYNNDPENKVDIKVIQREVFYRELISNGKLTAAVKAELCFDADGRIDSIGVKNGQWVKKGDILAVLRNDQLSYRYRLAALAMEKAGIDRLDALLGMGYKELNDSGIQSEHLVIANIRSGYSQAKLDFEEVSETVGHLVLKAPFDGKVEGIVKSLHERTTPQDIFCSLINEDLFMVMFPILESEKNEITEGHEIAVTPIYGHEEVSGKITTINPRVDANGLIRVHGEIINPGDLMEGMNVRVSIKKAFPQQLVVPKSAVILRQNREVLFRYTNGKAYWTYVNVLNENESQYAVEASREAVLNPGDTVIISNNLNLAHESVVRFQESGIRP